MADAPRFLYWWGHVVETSVLSMPREQWHDVVGRMNTPIAFDVRSTPLARVAEFSSVLGSIAHDFGRATARVSIFRHDPVDAPTPVNLDDYDVWTDVRSHPRLSDMITRASTSYNENFKAFCEEHVFFVKRKPGPDHWLPTIPSSVTLILKST